MGNNMTENPQHFLDVALAAVKKAEPIFVKHFGKPSGVLLKAGKTPSLVSDADKEIETLLTKEIATRFPEHAIAGEEFPPTQKKSEFRWHIDPIDGTTNYIHGFAHCAVSVGLWDGRGPLVGVVSDPISRVRYTAVRGRGAFRNSAAIRVSPESLLRKSLGAVGWSEVNAGVALLRRVAPLSYRVRTLGSSALELCFIAEGKLEYYVSGNIAIWDTAAGMLILTEAGGEVTDWQGNTFKTDSSQIVASNRKIHQELLVTLR